MTGFSTLPSCPFNNNTIFICKNYTQVRFSLMLGEEITDHAKKSESVTKRFTRTELVVSM